MKLTVNLANLVKGAGSDTHYPNINRDNTPHSHLTSQTNALSGTTTTASIHIVTDLDIEVSDSWYSVAHRINSRIFRLYNWLLSSFDRLSKYRQSDNPRHGSINNQQYDYRSSRTLEPWSRQCVLAPFVWWISRASSHGSVDELWNSGWPRT